MSGSQTLETMNVTFNYTELGTVIAQGHVISNQESRETVAGTSASITVSSVTTLNSTFSNTAVSNLNSHHGQGWVQIWMG